MNLFDTIINLFNNNDTSSGLLNIIKTLIQKENNSPPQDSNTHYYELPTYQYNTQNQNTPAPSANDNHIEIKEIIKLISSVLQLLGNKKQNTNTPPKQDAVIYEVDDSKISKLKRTNDEI